MPSTRCDTFRGFTLAPLLIGVLGWLAPASSRPAARAAPALARSREHDDPEAEAAFEKLKAKYEAARSQPVPQRIPIIMEFAGAPCAKAARYLARMYREETNLGLHMTVTKTLGAMGTREAIEAVVTQGAPLLVKDSFAAGALAEALEHPLRPDAEKWMLSKGVRSRVLRENAKVWRRFLKAVGRYKSDERIPFLTGEIYRAREPDVQVALLEAVSEIKSSKVATAASKLLRAKSGAVQAAALQCLFNQNAAKYRSRFISGLRSPTVEVRLLSLAILSRIGEKKIVDYASRLLEDPDPRVQVVAVRALLERGGKEVLPPLIGHLDHARGRVLDDLADALARLTGRNFGPFSAQWESWWVQFKDKPGEYRKLPMEEFAALKSAQKNQQTLLYHGLRVMSDHAAFIIDTSESMALTYVPKEEREKEGRGRTVVADPRAGGEKKVTRMDVARKELHTVVRGLKNGKNFDLIGFDSVVSDFIQDALGSPPEHLQRMDAATRLKARVFVDATKPAGQTHMLEALRSAFAYPDLDTIFLLSDGAPSPESGSMEEILHYVRRENRLRVVKVNAIGFDLESREKEFLIQLAEENFGTFVER